MHLLKEEEGRKATLRLISETLMFDPAERAAEILSLGGGPHRGGGTRADMRQRVPCCLRDLSGTPHFTETINLTYVRNLSLNFNEL